jgi:anti-sigma B factor antagonist
VYPGRTFARQSHHQSDSTAFGSGASQHTLSHPPATTSLLIDRQRDEDSVILVVQGEIDIASARELENALQAAVASGSRSRIVVDLAALEFIDSAGLRALIQAQRHARANGRTLILRHVPPQAKRVIQISGLADLFVTA